MESLSHHVEALRQDPTSEAAAAQVRKRARAQGDLRTYVDAFTERGSNLVERSMGPSAAVAYVEAAMVAEEIHDWALAADLYRHAYQADPTKRDPLVLLGRALTRAGQPRELVPTLREMLRASNDPAARAEIHLQLADYLATELQDRDAAMEEIRAALQGDRNSPATQARARDILNAHGLREAFQKLVAEESPRLLPTAPPPAQGPGPVIPVAPQAALFRASGVPPPVARGSVPPPRPSAAAPSAAAPSPAPSVPSPRSLASAPKAQAPRPQASAPPSYDDPPTPSAPPAPAPPRPDLDETKAEITILSKKLQGAPADLGIIDELMRLGQVVEDPTPVIHAYEAAARACTDASLRSYIRTRLGALYVRGLDQPEEAVRVFAAILEDEPRHPEARRMLVAREGPEAAVEGLTPEQEKLLIDGLEKGSDGSGPPSTHERILPTPSASAPAPVNIPPPPSFSIAPSARPSLSSAPYALPSLPPPRPRLTAGQIAGGLAVMLLAGGGGYVTFTDRLWPQLEIGSRPSGAAIYVDGNPRSETTPASIRLVPNRPHSIELRYPGAWPKMIEEHLSLGYLTESSTAAVLEPKARVARVGPVAARIELNGKLVATTTATLLRAFPLDGPVTVRFSANGYAPTEKAFKLGREMPETVSVTLAPAPK